MDERSDTSNPTPRDLNEAQPDAPFDLAARTAFHGERRRSGDSLAQTSLSLVLDEIDYGLLLLDPRRRLRHANRAAQMQLRERGGLALVGGELQPVDTKQRRAWDEALTLAYRGLRRLVTLGQSADRLALAVVPLPELFTEGGRCVLVMMSRSQICEALSVHGFARDHRLTGAEAKVFAALCRGVGPAKIASDSGVALSTVRSQIASIRAKAQVTSIRELVQRAAQLPPMVSSLRH